MDMRKYIEKLLMIYLYKIRYFPHLIDVGVMGHCIHGKTGLCVKAGIGCYQSGLTIEQPNMTVENFKWIAEQCKVLDEQRRYKEWNE